MNFKVKRNTAASLELKPLRLFRYQMRVATIATKAPQHFSESPPPTKGGHVTRYHCQPSSDTWWDGEVAPIPPPCSGLATNLTRWTMRSYQQRKSTLLSLPSISKTLMAEFSVKTLAATASCNSWWLDSSYAHGFLYSSDSTCGTGRSHSLGIGNPLPKSWPKCSFCKQKPTGKHWRSPSVFAYATLYMFYFYPSPLLTEISIQHLHPRTPCKPGAKGRAWLAASNHLPGGYIERWTQRILRFSSVDGSGGYDS